MHTVKGWQGDFTGIESTAALRYNEVSERPCLLAHAAPVPVSYTHLVLKKLVAYDYLDEADARRIGAQGAGA